MINTIKEKFKNSRVIPVLTLDDIDTSLKVADILIKTGLTNLEVTLRTNNALKCIEAIKKEFPLVNIGAGTIIKKEQFKQVKDVGALFAVSPGWSVNLVNEAKKVGIAYLPGVSTPSEMISLFEMGVDFMKFFHASHSGGYKMLKAYSNMFPQISFCPTGGISGKDFEDYLKLDNVVCIGGSWMVADKDIQEKNYTNIENIAKSIMKCL